MNRVGSWRWRLSVVMGALRYAFGRHPQMGIVYRRSPPQSLWYRLRHGFKPAPPPPLPRPAPPPPWVTEPEAELGVAVPIRQILVSNPDVAAALMDCVAYSTGFKFSIALRTKNEIKPQAMGFPMRPFQVESPTEQFHFRVRFADGSDSGAMVGMHQLFRDYFEAIQEGREPVIPSGPVVSPRSGGGGGRRWDFGYWVWPLPPDGPVTFTFEWPQYLDGEVTGAIDGTAIRQAGGRSEKLW